MTCVGWGAKLCSIQFAIISLLYFCCFLTSGHLATAHASDSSFAWLCWRDSQAKLESVCCVINLCMFSLVYQEYLYRTINQDVALRPGSNIKTKTFRVHAENCVLGGCSKHVARQKYVCMCIKIWKFSTNLCHLVYLLLIRLQDKVPVLGKKKQP